MSAAATFVDSATYPDPCVSYDPTETEMYQPTASRFGEQLLHTFPTRHSACPCGIPPLAIAHFNATAELARRQIAHLCANKLTTCKPSSAPGPQPWVTCGYGGSGSEPVTLSTSSTAAARAIYEQILSQPHATPRIQQPASSRGGGGTCSSARPTGLTPRTATTATSARGISPVSSARLSAPATANLSTPRQLTTTATANKSPAAIPQLQLQPPVIASSSRDPAPLACSMPEEPPGLTLSLASPVMMSPTSPNGTRLVVPPLPIPKSPDPVPITIAHQSPSSPSSSDDDDDVGEAKSKVNSSTATTTTSTTTTSVAYGRKGSSSRAVPSKPSPRPAGNPGISGPTLVTQAPAQTHMVSASVAVTGNATISATTSTQQRGFVSQTAASSNAHVITQSECEVVRNPQGHLIVHTTEGDVVTIIPNGRHVIVEEHNAHNGEVRILAESAAASSASTVQADLQVPPFHCCQGVTNGLTSTSPSSPPCIACLLQYRASQTSACPAHAEHQIVPLRPQCAQCSGALISHVPCRNPSRGRPSSSQSRPNLAPGSSPVSCSSSSSSAQRRRSPNVVVSGPYPEGKATTTTRKTHWRSSSVPLCTTADGSRGVAGVPTPKAGLGGTLCRGRAPLIAPGTPFTASPVYLHQLKYDAAAHQSFLHFYPPALLMDKDVRCHIRPDRHTQCCE